MCPFFYSKYKENIIWYSLHRHGQSYDDELQEYLFILLTNQSWVVFFLSTLYAHFCVIYVCFCENILAFCTLIYTSAYQYCMFRTYAIKFVCITCIKHVIDQWLIPGNLLYRHVSKCQHANDTIIYQMFFLWWSHYSMFQSRKENTDDMHHAYIAWIK